MAGEGDTPVGGWAPVPAEPAGGTSATDPAGAVGSVAEDQGGEWWAEIPDPWDLPDPAGEDTAADGAGGRGQPRTHRRRRSPRARSLFAGSLFAGFRLARSLFARSLFAGSRFARSLYARWIADRRRLVAVAAAVGAVLVGTGVLVNLVTSAPSGQVAPPTTPPELVATPPGTVSGLGVAPSPAVDPEATAPPPVSYEAEAAQLGGRAQAYQVDGASGGSAVRGIGMGEDGFVLFRDVDAETSGEHVLTLYYVDSRRGTARISVNDGQLVTVHFPSLGGAAVGEVSLRVDLVAGDNTVWFGHNGNGAPDLDRIVVSQP
jgi:hypothetical protein